MPISNSNQINQIIELFSFLKPSSVLDIGVGFGKYGFLCREYLDVANDSVKPYDKREIKIEGIEIYPEYITELQRHIYDKIHIGNALQVLPSLKEYFGLIIMVDVLEHFTREDGTRLIKEALRCSDNILIATPHLVHEQGAVYGNVHESHLCQWKKADLEKWGPIFIYPHPTTLIAIMGKGVPALTKQYSFFTQLKVAVSTRFPLLRKMYRVITCKKD